MDAFNSCRRELRPIHHAAICLTFALLAPLLACRRAVPVNPNPIAGEPQVMVWAWQRPTDLSFINPKTTGVSLLVKSVWLTGQGIAVEPNLDPVRFPPGTWLMACTRIEIARATRPALSSAQAQAAAAAIAEMARLPRVRAIQVDFDATRSQRGFYRIMLRSLRRMLPVGYPISITALASWCGGDDWLSGLPVQEAVPMLFQMGPDQYFAAFAHAGGVFREPLCRSSVGLGDDEPLQIPGNKRLYLFATRGWSTATFRSMMAVQGH